MGLSSLKKYRGRTTVEVHRSHRTERSTSKQKEAIDETSPNRQSGSTQEVYPEWNCAIPDSV